MRETVSRARHELVVFLLGLTALASLALLIPDLGPTYPGLASDQVHARITAYTPATADRPPSATIELLDGPDAGTSLAALVEGPSGQLELPDYHVGDEVLASIDHNPDGTLTVSVADRWRLPALALLFGLFVLVVVAVAGWRGLRSLVGLGVTVVLTIRLLIPLLLAGWNPVFLAIGLGIIMTVVTFALTLGIDSVSVSAALGTSGGLVITGILAAIVPVVAQFTSAQGSENAIYVQQLAGGRIDLGGLLLAAVVFGSLGVLNDVSVGQAATVDELRKVDPSLGPAELYRRAMNVGVSHIGATINTLVMAYLGTALPLLVLIAIQVKGLELVVNQELIASEIVRTLIGSIGLVSTVPLTTLLAVRLVRRGRAIG